MSLALMINVAAIPDDAAEIPAPKASDFNASVSLGLATICIGVPATFIANGQGSGAKILRLHVPTTTTKE